ncbi:MAG: FecR domain-containing protein [Lachnospiraceae bacterium]|nr:FecR domain-containing protein [Lachnospiraceae bacterium]
MKKTTTRLTALALSLALLLTSCGGGASATSMHLRKTEGTVGVSDGEGKDVTPQENLGLYSGYGVETQAESYAWIDLDKVKLTKLDAGSEVEIAKESKKLEINVVSGSLFFNVTEPLDDDETMNIVTSTMTIGVRGTCGWVGNNTAALLEGTVSVTAGDQEVTINAGEMVVLTKEGELKVREFTYDFVPGFVVREILDDDDLKQAVLDASGIRFPTSYEELLSMLNEEPGEEVVYSEIIDFEADGSPELLVIRNSPSGEYVRFQFTIYRDGPEGVRWITGTVPIIGSGTLYVTCSLVERDGRLFVECITASEGISGGDRYSFAVYIGSVAEEDGGPEDWDRVDLFRNGQRGGLAGDVARHNEDGFIISGNEWDEELSSVMMNPYTFVRELYRIDYDF